MSALGRKQTLSKPITNSCLRVRYRPKADIDMLQEMQDYLDADKEALWIKDCEPHVQNIIEQADIQKMFTIDLIS